ncbi:hypothetical protein RVR_4568 [Actinacidiphila reveromycinica]|uniref:Nudix hydrolase domain-containing protein n=1 Tax=Actinacidiphila reveromycinica TaxID=659352 RepID=A0A7U3VPA2_9ACTN|nr:hypothetical protein RVR_4568 [Streptomyces sp. SN-593]
MSPRLSTVILPIYRWAEGRKVWQGAEELGSHTAYKPGWEIPGGYLHPGETPSEGAARELKELGLTTPIGRLHVAD